MLEVFFYFPLFFLFCFCCFAVLNSILISSLCQSMLHHSPKFFITVQNTVEHPFFFFGVYLKLNHRGATRRVFWKVHLAPWSESFYKCLNVAMRWLCLQFLWKWNHLIKSACSVRQYSFIQSRSVVSDTACDKQRDGLSRTSHFLFVLFWQTITSL